MIKNVKLEKSLKMVVRWVVLHCAQGFCLVLGAMGAGASCMLFLHHPKPSFFQLNIFNSKLIVWKKCVSDLVDGGGIAWRRWRENVPWSDQLHPFFLLDHGAVKQSLHPSPDRQSTEKDNSCNQRQGWSY